MIWVLMLYDLAKKYLKLRILPKLIIASLLWDYPQKLPWTNLIPFGKTCEKLQTTLIFMMIFRRVRKFISKL